MVELFEVPNPGCSEECTDEDRENGICLKAKGVDDNLDLRCVGTWAKKKIALLVEYSKLFANTNKGWEGKVHYIEICSGPGRCMDRNGRTEFDGTALAVMKSANFHKYRKAIFFDRDEAVIETLQKRIGSLGDTVAGRAIACTGDYTKPEELMETMRQNGIMSRSINLIFIDPTDCSLPFSTIKTLSERMQATDFIINFPIYMDLMRNVRDAILMEKNFEKSRQKYLRFFGDPNFFDEIEVINAAKHDNRDALRELMNEKYKAQLRALGYQFFYPEKIDRYYYICFASRNPLGERFWKISVDATNGGQITFGFDI